MILLTEISSSGIIISCFLACVCAVCQAGHLSEGARWRRREEEEISCCSSRGQRRPDTGQGRRRLRGRFVLTETRPLHPRVCVCERADQCFLPLCSGVIPEEFGSCLFRLQECPDFCAFTHQTHRKPYTHGLWMSVQHI